VSGSGNACADPVAVAVDLVGLLMGSADSSTGFLFFVFYILFLEARQETDFDRFG
jgi:hypothetical protein